MQPGPALGKTAKGAVFQGNERLMKQAPIAVRLMAVAYAATPVLVIWLGQAELPSLSVLLPNLLLLGAAPVIAFGVFRVRRWALTALGTHFFFTLGIAAVDAYFYNGLGAPMLCDIGVVAAMVLRLMPTDIRAPYLSRDGRGFRMSPRHEINLQAELERDGVRVCGKTYDMSQGGTYIECVPDGLTVGERCFLTLHMRERELRCQARLVSVNPEGLGVKPPGVGLQFSNLKESDAKTIEVFLSLGRKHPRLNVVLPIELSADRRFLRSETINLSLGGCFVRDGVGVFQPGDSVMVKIELQTHDEIDCVAEVAWLAEEGADQVGLALQFSTLPKVDQRRLRERLEEQ